MDVNKIIPKNHNWKIDKDIVFVWYLAWIPIMNLKNDWIEIYFDIRLAKHILKLIPKIEGEFYLVSPTLVNPKKNHLSEEERNKVNILNMLSNYCNATFFHGFQSIGFDLITHLILYCKKFDSMLLIKDIYEDVNGDVQSKNWDYYTNNKSYVFPEEIRDEFNSLYRQIKLAEILN